MFRLMSPLKIITLFELYPAKNTLFVNTFTLLNLAKGVLSSNSV